MTTKTTRRHDPERRDRIIDVTLDVIAKQGVAGTTHRRVAEAADVSLGSMTYYFQGMEDLLREAFSRLAATMSSEFKAQLDTATTKAQARQILIDWICDDRWTSDRNLVLMLELSAFAAREPSMRPVIQQWMGTSEGYLSHHFGATTAKILDAFIDGVIMHNVMSKNHINRQEITELVEMLTS